MITIKNKADCCGCNACGDVCAYRAITFKTDIEGFWYPEVDTSKCIGCGLCEQVCPMIHAEELKRNDFEKPECWVANHKNIEVRFDSTSGGMFTAFANAIYKDGGYVGGAIFNEDFSVKQLISNNPEDLKVLRNTKYIQSDSQGFYKEVKKLLIAGEQVLICALPCQVAALKAYLRKGYENLITVDLFCRGINSPKVFRKFLDYLESKYNSKVVYVKPKSKELGWKKLTLKVVFENRETYYGTHDIDFFTKAFLQSNCITRPSCYDCPFKGFPRIADISIGDFWYRRPSEAAKIDDNMGTSALLLNSQKGKTFFAKVQKKLKSVSADLDIIVEGNPALVSNIGKEKMDRATFYDMLENKDFGEVVNTLFPEKLPFKQKCINMAKVMVHQLRFAQFHVKPMVEFIKLNFFHKGIHNVSLAHKRVIYISSYCDLEISPKASLVLKGSLEIGRSVYKNTKTETRIRMQPGAKFNLDGDWSLGYGGNIEIFSTGELTVKRGPWTNINFCVICQNKILLDEWAMIGRDVTIRDNNGGHDVGIYGYKNSLPVKIGKHVWLTSGVTVMAGVRIGDGAIVGANSVVLSSLPAHCVASGFPAKVTQENILWKM